MPFPLIKLIVLFLTVFSSLYTIVTARYGLLPYNLLLYALSCAVLGYEARQFQQRRKSNMLYIIAAIMAIFAIVYLCT